MMGFTNALNAAFSLHQINHAHWMYLNPDGAPWEHRNSECRAGVTPLP